MQIETISITVSKVINLGDYSSVKPSVTLSARLDASDTPYDVLTQLADDAEAKVAELIDAELIKSGKTPRYSDEPLYNVVSVWGVLASRNEGYMVVYPATFGVFTSLKLTNVTCHRMPRDYAITDAERYDDRRNTVRIVDTLDDADAVLGEIATLRAANDERERQLREQRAQPLHSLPAGQAVVEDDDESDDEDED